MMGDDGELLTPAAHAQLQAELEQLEGPKRKAAIEAIAVARALGREDRVRRPGVVEFRPMSVGSTELIQERRRRLGRRRSGKWMSVGSTELIQERRRRLGRRRSGK